mgnify:CR=1 FL=1
MSDDVLVDLTFASDPCQLKRVRDAVKAAAAPLGLSDKCLSELVIAVNEACMNIMQHAYLGDPSGQIGLKIRHEGRELKVLIEDSAAPVDLGAIAPRDLDDLRPGGLGTYFIHEIMDDCQYGHREGDCGNYLKMSKRIDK